MEPSKVRLSWSPPALPARQDDTATSLENQTKQVNPPTTAPKHARQGNIWKASNAKHAPTEPTVQKRPTKWPCKLWQGIGVFRTLPSSLSACTPALAWALQTSKTCVQTAALRKYLTPKAAIPRKGFGKAPECAPTVSRGTAAMVGEAAKNAEKRGSTFSSLSWWDVAY